LKEGKIAVEKYWGNNILNTASFDQNTNWYWASAGKTLTAFLVGLAQEKGLLDIQDKTSDYLGPNWTSLPPEKENLINIRHQLTMTTGLDYHVPDIFCTDPECLQYGQDAGTQWFYHNAPYTLLEQVVSNAAGVPYNQFTDTELESQTGMSGQWIRSGFNNLYWSTARDAARFGLLILNKGQWKDTPVMTDIDYYNAMITPSQDLNPSYGYLWC
jgi:CubicO group peptidase (beta-lactamase class C family)